MTGSPIELFWTAKDIVFTIITIRLSNGQVEVLPNAVKSYGAISEKVVASINYPTIVIPGIVKIVIASIFKIVITAALLPKLSLPA